MMTDQPNANSDQSGAVGTDRLGPRPLERPAVDQQQAAVFGRPHGVEGAFDKLYTPAPNGNGQKLTLAPPTPESLAEAFSRPAGAEGVRLQRPLEASGETGAAEDPLWTDTSDPWRDPAAGAVLAGPAVVPEEDEAEKPKLPKGAQLSLPEVLFGRRVQPKALALLGIVALVIGAVGGLAGWSAGGSRTRGPR
ncbi:hypothetical protein A4R44_05308 [Amycolatopsis sp. M39]|nr:hypothetical protein A4R44_05308 [Amycolatopsis sp. M39]